MSLLFCLHSNNLVNGSCRTVRNFIFPMQLASLSSLLVFDIIGSTVDLCEWHMSMLTNKPGLR